MKQRPGLLRRTAAAVGRVLTRVGAGASNLSKRSVWKGAELSRLWFDWIASPISADQELYNDFLRLRARAREMRRNHPIIRQYLGMLSSNVIGADGMKFQAQVRTNNGQLDRKTNEAIEEAWAEFWSSPVTVDQKFHGVDFEQHLIESLATDGEILVRKIRNFKGSKFRFALQELDPDLLDHQFFRQPTETDNEIRLGIEIDEWGAPVAYWFWDRHPTDLLMISARKRIRIMADEIIHIYRPDRANQTRGVTWLNSIMMPTKMLDGYVEAEVVAARTGAAKMGFFQWKDATDFEPPQQGEKLTMEASPGSFEQLPPGMEFKEWNPEHPSTAFPNFLKAVTRWIASGLRVSYNGLANDLEGVNYSSMRSGVLMERDEYRKLQKFWIRGFLRPIYSEWLEFAYLSGQLYLDQRDWQKFMKVRFLPRGWQWVDPLKDANASIAAINNGLTSRGRVIAEQGGDFEEILEELKEEQDLIDEMDVDLTGVGVGAGATAGDKPGSAADADQGDDGQAARARRLRLVRHAELMGEATRHTLARQMTED